MFPGRNIDYYYEDGELVNTTNAYFRAPEASSSFRIDTTAGDITVAHEPNPKPAIDNINVSPVVITSLPKDDEAALTITFRVNRHVEVTYSIDSPWYQNFKSLPIKLEPGIHTVTWNGRDNSGNKMPLSEYRVCFHGYELNFNRGYDQSVSNLCSPKFLYWPKTIQIPENRFREVIGNITVDKASFSPSETGVSETISGAVTLNQNAEVGVYIANGIDQRIMNVLESGTREPGTYTFHWDGKDYYGYIVPNGRYYIGLSLTEGDKRQDYIFKENSFAVTGSQDFKPQAPIQNVRITADYTKIRLYSGSLMMGFKGEVFPILENMPESGWEKEYMVLLAEGVPGYVKVSDIEWTDFIGQKLTIPRRTPGVSVTPTIYYVMAGDTLWKIAQKYGVTVNDLAVVNRLITGYPLRVHQKLIIPKVYHVIAGDTLWRIVQKNSTSIKKLLQINGIDANKPLYIGQRLLIGI